MAVTWTDISNGESALSIRGKINSFNASVVTETTSNTNAINTNTSNITTNANAISTNATNIATNTSDIATHDSRLDAIDIFHQQVGKYGTLIGPDTTGGANIYNLTTTYQDIDGFSTAGSLGTTVSTANGTITPSITGYYRVSLFMSGDMPVGSDSVVMLALIEGTSVLMEGVSTVTTSADKLGVSFTGIFQLTASTVYKTQIKSDAPYTLTVTANNFAVELVGL